MRQIPLSGKAGEGLFALLDDADYNTLSGYIWYRKRGKKTDYAVTSINRRNITMHRMILRDVIYPGHEVDHRDGNGLNNTRENIRPATVGQNHANRRKTRGSSKYIGVSWDRSTNKWRAQCNVNKRPISIGWFVSEEEAARAYDAFVISTWGDFARPNFKQEAERW